MSIFLSRLNFFPVFFNRITAFYNSYSHCRNGLSIGKAGVKQETIERALEALKKELQQPLSELTREISYKETDRGGHLLIPKDSDPVENRFKARLFYRISELNPSNPFESLLLALNERIKNLGHECITVEARFEKGVVASETPYWHLDGSSAFSICYGSNRNWSTRILNTKIHKKFHYIFNTLMENTPPEVIQRMEKKSECSLFGHFYNVHQVLHRSPKIEDLGGKVSADEYRLFVRFRETY